MPYLWPDAAYIRVRDGGRIVSRAVIVTVAVNDDGRRVQVLVSGAILAPQRRTVAAALRAVGLEGPAASPAIISGRP